MSRIGCEVTWNNLKLVENDKKIISNASGQIRPSTLTALLGPSGSGKSSLLNSIAGRIGSDQILTGDIQVNGQNRDEENWPRTVAYLGQKFYAYEWETVYETLLFASKMKFQSRKQSKIKIKEIIELLNLSSILNVPITKLSKKDKFKVNLGLELLGDPLVILVDEPLSGLDSYNAINILEILRKIANRGQTVMVTIHQPSYIMMSYFDSIMLMCQGSCVYEGTLNNCIKFFEECGFELPKNTTPTDFFLDILSIDNQTSSSTEASNRRIEVISREWNFIRTELEFKIKDPIILTSFIEPAGNYQMLIFRYFRNYIRNKDFINTLIIQKVIMIFALGLAYFNTGLENTDVFTFRGIMTVTLLTELFGVSSLVINSFMEEKKIVSRECMSGMYSGYEAYLTKFLSESLIYFSLAVPYHLTVYYLMGFPLKIKILLRFFLIIFVIINYSTAYGMAISTLVNTTFTTQVIGVGINVLSLLYSGAFSKLKNFPKLISWLSPSQYAFRALVKNQISSLPHENFSTSFSYPQIIISFGLEGMGIEVSIFILTIFTFLTLLGGCYFTHKSINLNIKKSKSNVNQSTSK